MITLAKQKPCKVKKLNYSIKPRPMTSAACYDTQKVKKKNKLKNKIFQEPLNQVSSFFFSFFLFLLLSTYISETVGMRDQENGE